MHPVLTKNLLMVKEQASMVRATVNFDILDPESKAVLLECREDVPFWVKMMRMTDYRHNSPFNVIIKSPEGKQIVRVNRGFSLFLSKVDVYDENDARVGG